MVSRSQNRSSLLLQLVREVTSPSFCPAPSEAALEAVHIKQNVYEDNCPGPWLGGAEHRYHIRGTTVLSECATQDRAVHPTRLGQIALLALSAIMSTSKSQAAATVAFPALPRVFLTRIAVTFVLGPSVSAVSADLTSASTSSASKSSSSSANSRKASGDAEVQGKGSPHSGHN